MRPWPFPSAGLDAAARGAVRRALARGAGRLAACLRAGLALGARRAVLLFALALDFAALAMMPSPSSSSLMRSRIDRLDGDRGKATQHCSAGAGAVPLAH